jgi:hypothetical protein
MEEICTDSGEQVVVYFRCDFFMKKEHFDKKRFDKIRKITSRYYTFSKLMIH